MCSNKLDVPDICVGNIERKIMREIKFRGIGIHSKEIRIGDLITAKDENGQIHYFIIDKEYDCKDSIIKINNCSNEEVIPETVGEYIGYKDETGKDIYTGDILKYVSGAKFIVVYGEAFIECPRDKMEFSSPGFFGVLVGDKKEVLCPLGPTHMLCEVIGNIHEDLELLKGV